MCFLHKWGKMGKDHIFGTSDNLGVDKTQTPLGGTDAGASQLVAIFTACSQLQKIKQKRPRRLAGSEKGIMNYGEFTNI